MRYVFLIFFLIACDERNTKPYPGTLENVDAMQAQRIVMAEKFLDDEYAWLMLQEGDAMLWQGKLAAVTCIGDIEASEYKETPGRFGRTPPPPCWTEKEGDRCSKTTWSRDASRGFFYWAYRCKKLDVLERHAEYGKANLWKMGEPLDDGRVLYTPAIIGQLYNAIFALGGEDSSGRIWPTLYPSGLTDYEAHLQMLGIQLNAELSTTIGEADAVPAPPPEDSQYVDLGEADGMLYLTDGPADHEGLLLSSGDLRLLTISETMFKRIEEHYDRDPNDPLFAAMHAIYTGDYAQAISLCEKAWTPEENVAEYVRCEDYRRCQLAHLIHSCDLILRVQNE